MREPNRIGIGVAAGGAIGALVRTGLVEIDVAMAAWALVAINVVGSFLLGVAVVKLSERPEILIAVGTGFCGGLTSMSTFAVDVAERLGDGRTTEGWMVLILTVVLAVAGAAGGLAFPTGESEPR
jgi:CrcB protein